MAVSSSVPAPAGLPRARSGVPVLRALEVPRFRALVLTAVAAPLLAGYLWQSLLQPVLDAAYDPKDWWVYLDAASAIARGQDPYQSFYGSTVADPLFNRGYLYPPLLGWLLQPLAGFRGHGLDVAELLFLHGCLAASLVLLLRAAGVRNRSEIVLVCALAVSWYPVRMDLMGQVNLVLLLLASIWTFATVRGRQTVEGLAAGAATALKLLLAPLLALACWRRRWTATAAGAAAVASLWGVAAPDRLPEYATRVLPLISGGTGYRENQAPTGTISRLLHPASLHGQVGALPLDVRVLGGAVSIAVAVVAWRHLRRLRSTGRGAPAEAALVFAAMPLVISMQSPSQYVTLLVSLVIAGHAGIVRRDGWLLALVAACYLLTGPVHTAYLTAITAGVPFDPWLRIWTEMGVVGLGAGFAAALRLVRLELAAARVDRRHAGTVPA